MVLLLVALARPQATVSLPQRVGTIVLAFDVSGSMAADDMQPTRIEVAKAAARAFVERQPRTIQIGVVAFSDSGFSVQAPTTDQDAVLTAISRLTPQRGTSVGQAIEASLKVITTPRNQGPRQYSNLAPTPLPSPTPVPSGTFIPAVIVLLSDGENNDRSNPLAAAQHAADRGVRIYTVGVGSTAGSVLKVNGFTVRTRLDEALLQQIAAISSGAYYAAANQQELEAVYTTLNPPFELKSQQIEVTALLAGASALLLLIGGTYSLLAFGRAP
jgi:Ca-activated chloride channel family protein